MIKTICGKTDTMKTKHPSITRRHLMSDDIYSIEELKSIVHPIAAKYDMHDVGLFGSYARGEATPESDIDILLFGNPGFKTTNVFGFAEDLYGATGKSVDVYEIGELLPGSFKDAVLAELVML